MAGVTKKDILHIKKLAGLDLTEDEIKKTIPQLTSIIDFVSKLDEVDTSSTKPTSQTTGLENIYRSDDVKRDNILTQAEAAGGIEDSKTYNGYFKVDAILSQRSEK
jgi:aspartyl-tRNA(Asn)/glutamyl-tRNA(Gln) amidotransferase subunit C